MSFGTGGFGGFGSTTNNNQSSGFGGFGQNNNNTSGFGANTTSAFGQNNNSGGGGLFGANTNANTNTTNTGTFGSPAGGFGSNSGFGSKPAFGATNTSGGSLFGASNANNTSTGFGGFGGNANNNTTASPFGAGSGGTTGNSLFGSTASKPAFGSSTTTGTSLFGGGTNNTTTNTGFGGGGFGAANNAAVGDPPGTNVAPFQAHTEKEANGTSTNSFQNILFQDPYKKWSAEELRLADYVQGRRHGNASGGGAFGVGSNFGGGFGSTNQTSGFGSNTTNTNTANTGGLFGSNNNATNTTTSGFGAAGTGFGASNTNTGGSLFGGAAAAKPSGGLFGSTTTQQTGGFGASATGGFGNTTNTGSAFGSTNNSTGLFGANKPQGGGGVFGGGAATNTATTGTGFGSGSAFGSGNTTGGGLFGNNNATNNQPSGGLFGNNNTQQQPQQNQGSVFGGGFGQQNQNQQSGGSLFGNAQQKPATNSLFGGGNTTQPAASGGLFGNANQQQQNTGGFGSTNTTSGGGIFGGAKPAAGGGLFGSTPTQTNTNTGGLFGNMSANNQTQQPAGSGLFGAASNNQQQKTGLFGSTNQNAGGSLFGNQNAQNQGSSLFGNSNNQQQQNSGLGNSLLGNSQQAQNTPQGLTANLNDVSAYGSPFLFSSLNNAEVANPGPLATPLNGNAKPKRGSILAMSKMAPSSASRYGTPQQKRAYGFSYSTYGTPGGSPASSIASTPGTMGRSLLASSSSGSLSKSMSVNNLRRNFNTEDSILAPGAFSSSSGARWYGSTGSKKLVINRDIRSDLFSTPQKDKQLGDANSSSRKLSKRVSFDTSNVEPAEETVIRGALPAPEDSPATQTDDTPRQTRHSIGSNGSNGSRTPDAGRGDATDLRDIREEDNSATPDGLSHNKSDSAPGDYYSSPSLEELQAMNRVKRESIPDLVVGRHNVGSIAFKVPVNMTGIEPEELYGGIIQLEPRSATVYPVAAKKPSVGKGLNVPARISLEQSWPRRDKRYTEERFRKHVDRLMRIPDTTFESYDKVTGVWVFSVEHFTTYGLDDSDDESEEDTRLVEQPAKQSSTPSQQMAFDVSMNSEMDDTFEFRHSRGPPGAFDQQEQMIESNYPSQQSFLGVSSADSVPNNVALSVDDEYTLDVGEEYDLSDDEDLTRSIAGQHPAAEQEENSSENELEIPQQGTPGGILRARMRAMKDSVEPMKLEVADGDDWMEMLRKTVSPAKRDRQILKTLNESPRHNGLANPDDEMEKPRASVWKKSAMGKLEAQSNSHIMEKKRGFATSIDLMNSLFEKPQATPSKGRASITATKGFPQWPYERQDKTLTIADGEKAFHDAGRPTWTTDETIILPRPVDSSSHVLRIGSAPKTPSKKYLSVQDQLTDIHVVDGVPAASLRAASIQDVFHHQDMSSPASMQEKRVWQLASLLFDDLQGQQTTKSRKAKLSAFWTDLVDSASSTAIGLARSSEEKAVACLAGHRITEACKYLFDGKDFRLATLVALIGTSDDAKKDMKEQLKAWHDSSMLSEYSEPIRAIYELLSGNVCVCEGTKGPVEDRVDSFVISENFGLDWKQAFGLRLWYGISQDAELADAVRIFADDIQQDKERLPQPWFREQGIEPLWTDPHPETRQDLLWGLLRLYADETTDLQDVLRPENSQLSPLDARLGWQLGLALVATGKVSFGQNAKEKADAATIAYASQLTAAGEWLEAVFVLLHLTDATARRRAIQEHICRHAGLIGPEAGTNFTILTEKFYIPASWVWEALALHSRSVEKDSAIEVQCLLKAGSFAEAHRVLIRDVAPLAIIERAYAELASLISQFQGQQDSISEWQRGGEIYSLFLSLVQHRSKGENASRAVLDRLLAGLHAMSESVPDSEIIRYAAVSDMADETAKEILHLTRKKQDTEFRSRILQLPLTQDRLLAYSADLGMERYMEVMTH